METSDKPKKQSISNMGMKYKRRQRERTGEKRDKTTMFLPGARRFYTLFITFCFSD